MPKVEADPGRLQQAIEILIGNALRRAGPGEVAISSLADSQAAVIHVADNGPGIEEHILPHVFDRFYHADAVPRAHTKAPDLV